MAWKYGFFDPVEVEPGVYDREYNSEEFSRPFSALIDTGVLQGAGGELEVTADGISMDTTIASGIAFINGRFAENIGTVTHTHDTESVGADRIDRIVIRLDLRPEARHVESFVKKGVASTNPAPPALQRDENVYEISLAQVYIRGGQSFIDPADITDERGDEDVCPWARSKVLPSYDQQDLDNLQQDFDAHKADNAPHRELLQVRRLNKDENGVFTTIEYDRLDGTLFKRTTLSGGESPNYTTRTVEFFDTDGETIVQTEVFNIIYDDDGDFLREEKVNA